MNVKGRNTASAFNTSTVLIGLLLSLNLTIAFAQGTQNSTTNFRYDNIGNLTQVTDPLSRVTTFVYDRRNRVVQVIPPVIAPSASTASIGITYDGLDQIRAISDPRGLVTEYNYTGLGNLSRVTSPDTGATEKTYDASGNVRTTKDALGRVAQYTYDALNRVALITFPKGAPTRFEYDGGINPIKNSIGQLTKIVDGSGATTFTHDQRGRLLTKTQTVKVGETTDVRITNYAYGTGGPSTNKIVSLTYPSGNRVEYEYGTDGRIKKVTMRTPAGASKVILDRVAYAPLGPIQSWVWGDSTAPFAIRYARTFDLDGRVTSYTLGHTGKGGLIRNLEYDAAGRITAYRHEGKKGMSPPASSFDQTFTYDSLDRLVGAIFSSGTQSYTYDTTGNRTQAQFGARTSSYQVNPSNNQLLSLAGPAGRQTIMYDATGNMIDDGVVQYSYLDNGRVNGIATRTGVSASYSYNGLGQRVSKSGSTVSGGTNIYVYDNSGQLLGEYVAKGAAIQETVYIGFQPVAVLVPNGTDAGVFNIYTDQLNTPRVITNALNHEIVWRWDTADPFGVSAPIEASVGGVPFTYNPRFPGQIYDRETNTHYNYFRDYDPQAGRYIQSDPIGLYGGINTYSYVGGNPLSYIDPKGLQIGVPVVPPPPVIPPRGNPYDSNLPPRGPRISDLFKPSPNLPTWDLPDWVYAAAGKPPRDASDPNGAKAPGKPGSAEGFCEPKPGKPQWGKSPNGNGSGWIDADGNVWVPTGPDSGSTGDAHGGPHWDVQRPGGGYENVYPGGKRR